MALARDSRRRDRGIRCLLGIARACVYVLDVLVDLKEEVVRSQKMLLRRPGETSRAREVVVRRQRIGHLRLRMMEGLRHRCNRDLSVADATTHIRRRR